MVPLRLAKIVVAGVPFTRKDEVSLKTWPVGPCGPSAVVGMAIVLGTWLTPAAVTVYWVLTFAAWSEIEKGLLALSEIPQGFLRLGSVIWARPGTSETRFVWTYPFWLGTMRSSRASSRRTTRCGRLGVAPRRVRAPLADLRLRACSHVWRRKVMTVAP